MWMDGLLLFWEHHAVFVPHAGQKPRAHFVYNVSVQKTKRVNHQNPRKSTEIHRKVDPDAKWHEYNNKLSLWSLIHVHRKRPKDL